MTDESCPLRKAENLRAEYAAVSAKLNQLPSFRFALIGFYLAAVGVIASLKEPDQHLFVLLMGLTLVLWLVDLRTRQLLAVITQRGLQIEQDCWNDKGWITQMSAHKPSAKVKWFFGSFRLPSWVSHSLGFDLLFLGILLYAATNVFK